MGIVENRNINEAYSVPEYELSDNIAISAGIKKPELINKLKSGQITTSVINKLHLIKLANDFPYMESDIPNHKELFQIRTVSDLCQMNTRAMEYDVDDFIYCKNVGFPLNRLITLRRYPYPCTDNIWDKESQGEPDIARLITYSSQEVNKFEDLLAFSYGLKWKDLTAEMEQATMQGAQSGLSDFMKKALGVFDPELTKNVLRGENANMLDPKADQNKVYGPVDSMTTTRIRDVGFDWTKEFEITFDYDLKSINGRTPEYAMKDIISNVLACTYNNGKFWPGSRYWIGERPSQFYKSYQFMNSDEIETQLTGAVLKLKTAIGNFSTKGSAIQLLKNAMSGGIAMAMGKILDKVGRPGILTMNSLLSAEPTGSWHLTIGNPINPIMCIGNLTCEGVDFNFPSGSLGYGDFPTKLQVKVKLKTGQPKDRAGAEMMFNAGKHRIYYAPKSVSVEKNSGNVGRKSRKFFGIDIEGKESEIDNMLSQSFDFISEGVKHVTETTKEVGKAVNRSGVMTDPSTNNVITMMSNVSGVITNRN